MLTFKSFLPMLVPSSVFCMVWLYWRRKNKLYLKAQTELGNVKCEEAPISSCAEAHAEADLVNKRLDVKPIIINKLIPEEGVELVAENCEMAWNNEIVSNEKKNVPEGYLLVADCRSNDKAPMEEKYLDVVEYDAHHVNQVDSNDNGNSFDMQSAAFENGKKGIDTSFENQNDLTYTSNSTQLATVDSSCKTPHSVRKTNVFFVGNTSKNKVDEEEMIVCMDDTSDNGISLESFGGRKTSKILTENISSHTSAGCFEEDLASDDLQFVNSKRLRNRSSCGDSAIVEDYSSDCLSMTGSDSAVKSFESESSVSVETTREETCCKRGCFAPDNGRNYRDWYGSTLTASNPIERSGKSCNWGSVPVSDTDSDSECILKSAKIGGVSLDKLSIVLSEEISNIKSTSEKIAIPISHMHPKPGRRRNRKSESRAAKKVVQSKQLQYPKRCDTQFQKNRSSSMKKDIDKPWRNLDCGKMQEIIPKLEIEKREIAEYEFPDDMCGRLIGKSGRHITEFKEKADVDICIECELRGKNRIVSITGLPAKIKSAEKILNEKFHDSLKRIDYPGILEIASKYSVTKLPDNCDINVIVTAIVDPSSFHVQIFHQDVDEKLMALQKDMAGCYATPRQKYVYSDKDMPQLGEFCIAFIDNIWCRLKVLQTFTETRMVDLFFIDYGGNIILSADCIWKIRPDLLELPAQAVHCCLYNVAPLDGVEFSFEANNLFLQYVEGKVLQAYSMTNDRDLTSIRLTYYEPARGEVFSIGDQLMFWGAVREEENLIHYSSS